MSKLKRIIENGKPKYFRGENPISRKEFLKFGEYDYSELTGNEKKSFTALSRIQEDNKFVSSTKQKAYFKAVKDYQEALNVPQTARVKSSKNMWRQIPNLDELIKDIKKQENIPFQYRFKEKRKFSVMEQLKSELKGFNDYILFGKSYTYDEFIKQVQSRTAGEVSLIWFDSVEAVDKQFIRIDEMTAYIDGNYETL